MEAEAAAQLGEPVSLGVLLQPVGAGTRAAVRTAPLFGVAALPGVAVRARKERQDLAAAGDAASVVQGSAGYLAVTPSQVGLFAVELGRLGRTTLGDRLATFRPGDVTALRLTRPASRVGIAVELVDRSGHRYRYEIPTAHRRRLTEAAAALGVVPDATGLAARRSEVIAVAVLLVVIAILLAYVLTNL